MERLSLAVCTIADILRKEKVVQNWATKKEKILYLFQKYLQDITLWLGKSNKRPVPQVWLLAIRSRNKHTWDHALNKQLWGETNYPWSWFGQYIFSISRVLKLITNIKCLRYPTTYFIHCDLIDRNQNLFNNKSSDLLAKLNVKGKAYEKVSYHASPQQPFRDCSLSSHVNSITLSVRDQDGGLFDFNGLPLEFELEIN